MYTLKTVILFSMCFKIYMKVVNWTWPYFSGKMFKKKPQKYLNKRIALFSQFVRFAPKRQCSNSVTTIFVFNENKDIEKVVLQIKNTYVHIFTNIEVCFICNRCIIHSGGINHSGTKPNSFIFLIHL